MRPYFDDGQCRIYNADARDFIADAPDCFKTDLVLTDPPYGVGVEYGGFVDTPENVFRLVGSVIPWCIQHARTVVLTCATRQQHFYPPPTWVLCWLNRAGSFPNPWGFTCWQPVMVYGPDPFLARGLGSRSDVIEHSETAEKNGHPVPKPEHFWKKLLIRTALPGDRIFDPFMGSGTTLRVAKDMGMAAWGVEIEERYCEIAAKRLSQKVLEFGS